MSTDPNLVDLLQQIQKELHSQTEHLNAIQTGFASENSSSSAWLHHLIDFWVILFADIGAAVVILVTFESWREKDRQHTERAQRILSKLGPVLPSFIQNLTRLVPQMQAAPNTGFAMPWGSNSSMNALLTDPELSPGSLDWEYPGGANLKAALTDLRNQIGAIDRLPTGAAFSRVQKVLDKAQALGKIQDSHLNKYARGKTTLTWSRFVHWVISKMIRQSKM